MSPLPCHFSSPGIRMVISGLTLLLIVLNGGGETTPHRTGPQPDRVLIRLDPDGPADTGCG